MSKRIKGPEELEVTIIGEPDFDAIPEAKLDLFFEFCMESLNKFYHGGGKESLEAAHARAGKLQNAT